MFGIGDSWKFDILVYICYFLYSTYLEVYILEDIRDLLATIKRVDAQLLRQDVSCNVKIFHLGEKADAFDEIGSRIISGNIQVDQVREFLPEYDSAEKFLTRALIWQYNRGDWQKAVALAQKIIAEEFGISAYTQVIIKKSLFYARVLAEEFHDQKRTEELNALIDDFGIKYKL